MDANNTPILKTPSTLRFITTSFLIVEIENSLREWRQSIRGDDPCQGKTSECHSKMRSSYSSKVESSCSKPANWPDERTGDAGVSLLSCFGSAIKGAPLLARPSEYQPLTASS